MTNDNSTPIADVDDNTVTRHIETLERRLRTRSRILTGEGFARGHNENSERVAEWEAEQRAALDEFTAQLTYWKNVRDGRAESEKTTAGAVEYVVPVDPMEELNCDSCQ